MKILGCLTFIALVLLSLFVGTVFWAWILMLVAGAIHFTWHGHTPGFWTCAPVGFLLSVILGAMSQGVS